jgi:hypothetical protein
MATAAINPYLYAGVEGANLITSIIGMIMNKSSMDKAREEARDIDERNFSYQQRRDATADRFARESLKLAKSQDQLAKNRFGLESMATGYNINKDMVSNVLNMLNTNTGLRDRVLRNWSL